MSLLSSADYLAMEESSDVCREFVSGQVFAFVGARDSHNVVALNIASALRPQVWGRCHAYMSDVKLRVEAADAYYCPDVFVTYDARGSDPYVKQYASLVIEVLWPRTEGIDQREKLRNYRYRYSARVRHRFRGRENDRDLPSRSGQRMTHSMVRLEVYLAFPRSPGETAFGVRSRDRDDSQNARRVPRTGAIDSKPNTMK